jgi:hypothetical protein
MIDYVALASLMRSHIIEEGHNILYQLEIP